MVGRGRQSKACLTCLRRKKGCDQQRPACGQCRKAAINCEGYDRPLIFKNAGLPPPPPNIARQQPAEASSIVQPESLTRLAYQTRLIDLFWRSYLPNGQALPREIGFISVGGWIDAVQREQHASHVLTRALLALSLAVVGRNDRTTWMTVEGASRYGEALRDMTATLTTQKLKGERSLQAIIVVRLLSFYEAMQLRDTEHQIIQQAYNWEMHNTGEIALLQTNPPIYYAQGLAHRLFVDGRMHLTINALRTRKKIFLSEPKWKTIPWTNHAKTPKDHIVDILVDIPSLLERIDAFKTTSTHQTNTKAWQKLLAACYNLESRLTRWHETFAAPYNSVPLDPTLPTYDSTQAIPAAHLLTLYWIASLTTLTQLRGLLPNPDLPPSPDPSTSPTPSQSSRLSSGETPTSTQSPPPPASSPIPTLPSRPPTEAERTESLRAHMLSDLFCHNIVHALPVFLHASTGTFRFHLATLPLAVVMRHLAHPGSRGRLVAEREMMREFMLLPQCAVMVQFIRGGTKTAAQARGTVVEMEGSGSERASSESSVGSSSAGAGAGGFGGGSPAESTRTGGSVDSED